MDKIIEKLRAVAHVG